MAILPSITIDRHSLLTRFLMPHQILWVLAEDHLHAQGKQAVILAEKSVRIGWTHADAFKNVRKRLHFKNRDYLFATKDYPSALEYMRLCKKFSDVFNVARCIISHGEEYLKIPRLDSNGKPTAFTDQIKIGLIKFDNGSRIIAFSANPQAMSVYGGDVGLDEFAKHPNARLLWETAQGRVTWNYDLALWSSHDGEDTLFNEFAHEARMACTLAKPDQSSSSSFSSSSSPAAERRDGSSSSSFSSSSSPAVVDQTPAMPSHNSHSSHSQHAIRNTQHATPLAPQPSEPSSDNHVSRFTFHSPIKNQKSKIENCPSPSSPWNLYFRVTLLDAIDLGLVDTINRARGTHVTAEQFVADCRARARDEEVFQQSYMCNPLGAAASHIVEGSAIERCRSDYKLERVHLEANQVLQLFGEFNPRSEDDREEKIHDFLKQHFSKILEENDKPKPKKKHRLGFDVAASGQGDLATFYIDQADGDQLYLRALLTCRTEDWHFLKTVLFYFMKNLSNVEAAGDESGLGRQICWEAAGKFSWAFSKVNFAAKKHDLGFSLMNQLSVAEKHFPRSETDIAADYFALRKTHTGTRWVFSEGRNTLNPASHCDIAWAGALASYAHTERRPRVWARVG